MVLGARHTENGSYENATMEMVCNGLPHGECFSRTYYTGTDFYGLAEVFQRGGPPPKWGGTPRVPPRLGGYPPLLGGLPYLGGTPLLGEVPLQMGGAGFN